MKTFLIENTRKGLIIKVTLHNPPYENENILNKTGWKEKDCAIKEVYSGYDEDMNSDGMIIDIDITDEGEDNVQ